MYHAIIGFAKKLQLSIVHKQAKLLSLLHTSSCLVSWNELGGVGESVVDSWVSQVIGQVLQWSLSGHDGLDIESEHGEHSKTSVLDFLHLQLSEGIWVVSQTQWVEWTTWVQSVKTLGPFKVTSAVTVSLDGTHEDDLDNQSGNNTVGIDESVDSEVLDTLVLEDLGTSIEPSNVSSVGGPFWDQAAQGTEHSPAGVDQLQLSVTGKSLWIGRESCGIPAVVSWEFTSEVWHLWGEWSKVFWAVWSVPAYIANRKTFSTANRIETTMIRRLEITQSRSTRTPSRHFVSKQGEPGIRPRPRDLSGGPLLAD